MKLRLFTPGPTPVPHAVRMAMARPMMHHRDKAFAVLLKRVQQNLAWVMGTNEQPVVLGGSGTHAMEAAVTHCVSPGDTALYINSGKFGARFGEMLRAFKVDAHEVTVAPGKAVQPQAVADALRAHPSARALFWQACETSTGVSHPVRELAALCHEQQNCLAIVDGITHVAIEPLPMDALGIDVLLGATQKSFMMSAGLSIIALSTRAWRRAQKNVMPRFYGNLLAERQAQSQGHTAWTSSVSLWFGLDVALQMMRDEGLERIYARHEAMAKRCRANLVANGCSLFAERPARGLTVVRPAAGMEAGAVIAELEKAHGMRIGGGQDSLVGKILRVAHMGHLDLHDVDMVTNALGEVLRSLKSAIVPA